MKNILFVNIVVLVILATANCACSGRDCVVETATVEKCQQVAAQPPRGTYQFEKNFHLNTDYQVLGGKIAAYKIQWGSGSWTGWFVPGVNDIDSKFSTIDGVKQLRRMWSYFADHTHIYIICKSDADAHKNCSNTACNQNWTQWIDRDDPSGTGDWEILSYILKQQYKVCKQPIAIQCAVADGKPAWSTDENIIWINVKG